MVPPHHRDWTLGAKKGLAALSDIRPPQAVGRASERGDQFKVGLQFVQRTWPGDPPVVHAREEAAVTNVSHQHAGAMAQSPGPAVPPADCGLP